MTSTQDWRSGATGQSSTSVEPNAIYGGTVELVIFLESEFTVGTSWELLERALEFIDLKLVPLYGPPIRFIAAPEWSVQGIDKLTKKAGK